MRRRLQKAYLAAGYFALAAAAVIAQNSPATSFELSIYTGTPITVWVGCLLAFIVATTCAYACRDRLRVLAVALGSGTLLLIASLPLVRDYRYIGGGDALTHLGWTRAIYWGQMAPQRLLYPAIHTITVELKLVVGGTLERNLMLVVVVITLAFIVGVPLVVRQLIDSPWAAVTGAVSAWLLLPINNIASYLMPFPTTQAILFTPIAVLAIVLFLRRHPGANSLGFGVTPYGVVLILLTCGLLLIHPQQTVNVLVMMSVICTIQFVIRWFELGKVARHHRPLYTQTAALAAVFVAWGLSHSRVQAALRGMGEELLAGGGPGSTATIAQRSQSIIALGSSPVTIFLKLFGVSLLYIGLSGLVVLAILYYRSFDEDGESIVTYLALACIPLTGLMFVYYVSTPKMSFRQLAFLMVLATIMGAVALTRVIDRFNRRYPSRGVSTVAATVMAALLLISLLTVFPSPFIYKATGHISDQRYEGYATALNYQAPGENITGIRAGPLRYQQGIKGVTNPTPPKLKAYSQSIPQKNFNGGNLTEGYNNTTYAIVTNADRQRELKLYHGFRYHRKGFQQIQNEQGVDRVMTNGALRLYVVHGTGNRTAGKSSARINRKRASHGT